jgi:4-amino-4-deoxy-L-arabinose transferase-like glycosyltransferase
LKNRQLWLNLHNTHVAVFGMIFILYLIVAGLFAVFTPPWQSPDEPAHYNYIAQVAGQGCCPVIEIGDWDSSYLGQLTSSRFAPDTLNNLAALEYEDHQPPLYYLIASLLFPLTDGSLIALRLLSVLFGAGVVASAYAIGLVMYPARPQVALGAAAFVAFLPQHVAMLASVNNDGLAECLIGITLLATIVYLKSRPGAVAAWQLGLLVGIGLVTKATTYFLFGVVPLAIFLRWWFGRREMPLLRELALFFIPALVLGSVWWVRNLNVYGAPDFLGLREHNIVVADQPRTGELIAEIGVSAYLGRALQTTYNSFFGQFGWMALPMPGWIYTLFLGFIVIALAGLVIGSRVRAPDESPADQGQQISQRNAWIVLSLTALLAVLAYIYYNTEFLQFQGRYLFPGLIPLGLWLALGLDGWRVLLFGRNINLNTCVFAHLPVGVMGMIALLDIYLLWRVIVPGLAP